jgi:hypothetical protein
MPQHGNPLSPPKSIATDNPTRQTTNRPRGDQTDIAPRRPAPPPSLVLSPLDGGGDATVIASIDTRPTIPRNTDHDPGKAHGAHSDMQDRVGHEHDQEHGGRRGVDECLEDNLGGAGTAGFFLLVHGNDQSSCLDDGVCVSPDDDGSDILDSSVGWMIGVIVVAAASGGRGTGTGVAIGGDMIGNVDRTNVLRLVGDNDLLVMTVLLGLLMNLALVGRTTPLGWRWGSRIAGLAASCLTSPGVFPGRHVGVLLDA